MVGNQNPYRPLYMKLIIILSTLFLLLIPISISEQPYINYVVVYETPKDLIIRLSNQYGFNQETALRIADCESNFNPLAKNKYSSAKGTYQFIDKTWKNYCDGDVLNDYDNIRCFLRLYNNNKNWWICQ